jgi:flagellar basal-body rod protein FlgB
MQNVSGQIDLLQQLMATAEVRHRVLSQNLANVNTPGYHRLDVSFDEELQRHLRGEAGTPEAVEQAGLPERADGNNVDVDQELGQLSQNALIHQAATQLIVSQMSKLRRAMS